MKTFPKPLTKAEEIHYLNLLKQGDTEAKNILIEKNMRLVAHMVKKYSYTDIADNEDLISVGTIGLIKAVNSFDVDKGNRFATYAAKCIENELLMFFRNNRKTSKDISIYGPIGVDKEGNEINLLDIIESNDEDIVEKMAYGDSIEYFRNHISRILTAREEDIIEMRYGLKTGSEVTQREVANLLGISRSYVSRIEKKALMKLREEFEKNEK